MKQLADPNGSRYRITVAVQSQAPEKYEAIIGVIRFILEALRIFRRRIVTASAYTAASDDSWQILLTASIKRSADPIMYFVHDFELFRLLISSG